MEDSSLDRLLEAEKAAQKRIEEASKEAGRILDEARSRAESEHRSSIEGFRADRERRLNEANMSSDRESERIRRDGKDIADGLSGRVRGRVQRAVQEVINLYSV